MKMEGALIGAGPRCARSALCAAYCFATRDPVGGKRRPLNRRYRSLHWCLIQDDPRGIRQAKLSCAAENV